VDERVGETVGDLLARQREGGLRVKDRENREAGRVADAGLLVQTTARDNTAVVHLSASGREGNNSSERAVGARLVVAIALASPLAKDVIGVVGLGPVGSESHELGAVDNRATTNSKKEVDLLLLEEGDTLHDGVIVRVRLNAAKLGNHAVAKLLLNLIVDAVALDGATAIGHHDTLALRNKLAKLVKRTLAKNSTSRAAVLKVLKVMRRRSVIRHLFHNNKN